MPAPRANSALLSFLSIRARVLSHESPTLVVVKPVFPLLAPESTSTAAKKPPCSPRWVTFTPTLVGHYYSGANTLHVGLLSADERSRAEALLRGGAGPHGEV